VLSHRGARVEAREERLGRGAGALERRVCGRLGRRRRGRRALLAPVAHQPPHVARRRGRGLGLGVGAGRVGEERRQQRDAEERTARVERVELERDAPLGGEAKERLEELRVVAVARLLEADGGARAAAEQRVRGRAAAGRELEDEVLGARGQLLAPGEAAARWGVL
jgi:hypothetical protein